MDAQTFIHQWPGTLVLVWSAQAVEACRKQLRTGGNPPAAVRAAIPVHASLALAFYPRSGTKNNTLVSQLYGCRTGHEPALIVDVSEFHPPLMPGSEHVIGIALPEHYAAIMPWIEIVSSGRLYESVAAVLAPLGALTMGADEDGDASPIAYSSVYCTSDECLLLKDPEIRCNECGAAFCSDSCKLQATHLCFKIKK